MTTHFISAEISLQENPLRLQEKIEAELEKRGKPLRWAITDVDIEKHTVHVEGIITK